MSSSTSTVFDLHPVKVETAPFPHVMRDGFLDPDLYQQLLGTFPDCPPSSGPSGHGLFWGDPAYDRLIERPGAWRSLFEAAHSQAFVDYVLAQFSDTFASQSIVDLGRARYVPYQESREDKERASIREPKHAPDEVWVRVDIHEARGGYDRRIHVDHRRRLMSMLIYFCDVDEAQMVGGTLILEPNDIGFPPWHSKTVEPRHNRMVMFPCSVDSFHSVKPISFSRQRRRYVQIHVSSSVDTWPVPTPSPALATYNRVRDFFPVRIARQAVRRALRAGARVRSG